MMLIDQIKADNLVARKARDAATSTALTTLYAEIAKIGKDDGNRVTTDDESQAVIRKFIKGIDDTLQYKSEDDSGPLLFEKELISGYLPVQMSDEDLEDIIRDMVLTLKVDSIKQMGMVMAELKKQHNGSYNGKKASELVKTHLL